MSRLFVSLFVIIFISSCSSSKKITARNNSGISRLRFVNEYVYPNGVTLNGAIIGGLSDIEYDSKRNLYYMICDDPSAKGDARYFTASISIGEKGQCKDDECNVPS